MIEKIEMNGTYAYKDFIDDEVKQTLLNWVDSNFKSFTINPISPNRRYKKISKNEPIHELVLSLKNKIIELENITDWRKEPIFEDFIGVNGEGAQIHVHSDENEGDYIHTRWNLILSYPEDGGHSIYDNKINILQENLIWKCVAGKYRHGSTQVIGKKPRITLSIGFLIKETNQ
jgi:hypothetical protein